MSKTNDWKFKPCSYFGSPDDEVSFSIKEIKELFRQRKTRKKKKKKINPSRNKK